VIVTSGTPATANASQNTAAITTTINSVGCVLGSTCSLTAPPALDVRFVPAGVSDGGTAFAGGLTRYDNNQPQVGSVNPAISSLGYLAYQAAPSLPQYAEQTIALPPYWTGTSLTVQFYSAATSGNVTWEVQSSCTAANTAIGSATFGTAATVTANVSATSTGLVTTSSVTVAANSANGCPATGATASSMMTYRIFRGPSDTASGNANLLGVTLSTGRTQ
jgi:hypothetical protein